MENECLVYTTHIDVRFAETDAMGIVHHATYPIWFEQARTEFFKAAGAPYTKIEQEGFESPVLELNVQYRRPCKFGDVVKVITSLSRESSLKWKFHYKVYVEETLCTTGSSLHAFTKKGLPTREMPECFKAIANKIIAQ